MPALRDSQLLGVKHVLLSALPIGFDQRNDRVTIWRSSRRAKIRNHLGEDTFPVDIRGQHPFHVLHDERGGLQSTEDSDVLSVEEMPVIFARNVISDPLISGASYQGIRLTRWPADE